MFDAAHIMIFLVLGSILIGAANQPKVHRSELRAIFCKVRGQLNLHILQDVRVQPLKYSWYL